MKKREALNELKRFLLLLLFITFNFLGLTLMNMVFVISPVTIFGQPLTVNVGILLLLLATLILIIILRG